jgi:preprotein translocase subunit SecA
VFAVLQTFLFKERIYQKALALEEITGRKAVWPGEARSHGIAGIAEAVRDMGWVKRNDPCPCGSGRKFKSCHMGKLKR